MKKSIIIFICILSVLLAVLPAYAKTVEKTIEGVTFSIDDDYTISTQHDLSPSSLVKGLLFVAISSDSQHQIQGRLTSTEFSRELESFSNLDKSTIAPAGEKLFPNGYETVVLNSTLYLKSIETNEDFTTVVYVTVSNGNLYTFSYFGPDATRIGEFMATVTLPKSKGQSNLSTIIIIIVSFLILADLVFLYLLIMSFVKDYRHKKQDRDQNIVSQYIKIKRRKY